MAMRSSSAGGRVWTSAGFWLAAALFLVAASSATAATPGPDQSFGKHGRVTTAIPTGANWAKAVTTARATPGGGVIVLVSPAQGEAPARLVRYRADGRLDQGFGKGGVLTVPTNSGTRFLPAGLAVDSKGRILIAGTESRIDEGVYTDQIAVIRRLRPGGTPDASFGQDGVVRSYLGAPAPSEVAIIETQSAPRTPRVSVAGIAVDRQDRILISAKYAAGSVSCDRDFLLAGTGPLVARLTGGGALDPSFGQGGAWLKREVAPAPVGSLVPGGAGDVFSLAVANCSGSQSLISVDETGSSNSGFGTGGSLNLESHGLPNTVQIATDRRGRVLLLSGTEGPPLKARAVLERLLPNGHADRRFGRNGRVSVTVPASSRVAAIETERDGSILLGESIVPRTTAGGVPVHGQFGLAHLSAKGVIDRGFAQGGRITTGFGKKASALAEQVTLDARGRAVVVGPIESRGLHGGVGVALARFRLGR
jgi:uncharacterized delta-60 repeat protein